MAMKYNDAVKLYHSILDRLQDVQEWQKFLSAAATLYKYPFTDQVMVYAQRPDAAAVASFDLWTKTMHRFIKSGTSGIALIDHHGQQRRLKYVFDISDTYPSKASLFPNPWRLKQSDTERLAAVISDTYHIPKQPSIEQQVALVCRKICTESFQELLSEESFEDADLKQAVSSAVRSVVLQRCSMPSQQSASLPTELGRRRLIEIGTAVQIISRQILTQVGDIVKERGNQHEFRETEITRRGDGREIHQEGGLLLPGLNPGRLAAGAAAGKIRQDESELSDGVQTRAARIDVVGRNTIPISFGSGQGSGGNAGKANQANGERRGRNRKHEEHGHAWLGRQDEQHQEPGNRDRDRGAYQQLTFVHSEQQTDNIQAEGNTLSAFSFVQETADDDPTQQEVQHSSLFVEQVMRDAESLADSQPSYERFSVIETDHGYAVWDDIQGKVYVDDSGVSEEFTSEWQANDYLQEIKKAVSAKESAQWLYNERSKFEAENDTALDASQTEHETNNALAFPSVNFHITDEHLGEGGAKQKFKDNMNAVKLLKVLEAEDRNALQEEQEILSRYVGWGGLADAFDANKAGWAEEFKELLSALTPEEYAAARASTLNAHYTSPSVIRAMYEALEQMGFEGGNILEPSCGVGNFFGMLPDSMRSSSLYGVELDSISGRIAQKLYPNANIKVAGFETTDRRDFYDLAIGNVPFGQYQVNDQAYNHLKFNIHNYFFAKALDQVRPGGIVAFITSRYTMDSKNPDARKYIAQRAELLGAIRLPNNAFKANAGTEVVSDILFLQKKDTSNSEALPRWVYSVQNTDGFWVNQYFEDHPEAVLGEQTQKSTAHGMDYTVTAISGADLSEQLRKAASSFVSKVYSALPVVEMVEGQEEAKETADSSIKKYSFGMVDGKVYYRENDSMEQCELTGKLLERVKGLIALRDCVHSLINLQLQDAEDSQIEAQQKQLNQLYDNFTEEHGPINTRANKLAFDKDSSYYLLCSLEEIDEGKPPRKAAIFHKRTIRPVKKITHVDTAVEALGVSLSEHGCVNLDFMQQLTDKPQETLIQELKSIIYEIPLSGCYVTADEYLSGNIREKLAFAQEAAKENPEYLFHVDALEKVMPEPLDASEIDVRLGSTWVDTQYIQQFMEETFQPPYWAKKTIKVEYSAATGNWNISGESNISYNDIAAYTTYGTQRASAYRILEDSLNLRNTKIYDTKEDANGSTIRVLNEKETQMAALKQEEIQQAFKDWIWKEPHRREVLVTKYNEMFNSTRPREYDGSHLTFPGMNPMVELRPHQKNAIARILYGGNTLLAHVVGAGKTFEMVAAAMESKRLGMCRKPMFIVPNHITDQWGIEFLSLYPAANILVATQEDFSTENRKKFCAKIATGDYDAVIIGHSQFEKTPLSAEYQEKALSVQLKDVEQGILQSSERTFSVKEMERTKKSLEAKLEKLRAENRKDDVVTFEQLGVDRVFVDEAHNYKNLFFVTKMNNVAGISTTNAQKSSDMFMKCQYLNEMTENRGVIFATGTPVSNSMAELYTMQRYLQYSTLQEKGLAHFDSWAADFGETTTGFELSATGKGFVTRTRFSKFYNLPELMNLFKEVADIKTADELNLPRPHAEYINVVAKPTEHQKELMESISQRATAIKEGSVDPTVDNMLKITSDGRKLGLDQRLIDPYLPDDPNSKVNLCVDNIFDIWQKYADTRAAQLVFCDTSTPKPKNDDLPFTDIYTDVKKKLIQKGIPEKEIAFIHDAKTDQQKKVLFKNVRAGNVRVLIGSTQKMGAGTNVQKRLIALHDLDCPWRPGDLEQRAGRILRQGNDNKEVLIYRYVTDATFDAYLWQTIENKQKYISQIMTSKSPVRSYEDTDDLTLSYAEVKALCSGNPYIKEKMELDVRVAKLRSLKSSHDSLIYRLQDDVTKHFPAKLQELQVQKQNLANDIQRGVSDEFSIILDGKRYTERAAAGKALLELLPKMRKQLPAAVGEYQSFSLVLDTGFFQESFVLKIKGSGTYHTVLGADGVGNMLRLENKLNSLPKELEKAEQAICDTQMQMNRAQAELQKPFEKAEELKAAQERLTVLNMLLSQDAKTPEQKPAQSAYEREVMEY